MTQLWVQPLAEGPATQLTDGMTADWSPSWSADGRRLDFVSIRSGSMDLSSRAHALSVTTVAVPAARFSDFTQGRWRRGIQNHGALLVTGDQKLLSVSEVGLPPTLRCLV